MCEYIFRLYSIVSAKLTVTYFLLDSKPFYWWNICLFLPLLLFDSTNWQNTWGRFPFLVENYRAYFFSRILKHHFWPCLKNQRIRKKLYHPNSRLYSILCGLIIYAKLWFFIHLLFFQLYCRTFGNPRTILFQNL